MGLSTSSNLFEKFSRALEFIALKHMRASHVTLFLDDFLLAATSYKKCKADLDNFIEFCYMTGVPISKKKTFEPATTMEFLGITLDTIAQQARLPQEKVAKALEMLSSLEHRKKVSLKELQSLIGFLNFCCCVVLPGRPFLRRLIDATRNLKNHTTPRDLHTV